MILEFNQYDKSDKMPYIIYADIESKIDRRENNTETDRCGNNPENSSRTKIGDIFFADTQCQQLGHLIT